MNIVLDIPSLLEGMPVNDGQGEEFTKLAVSEVTHGIYREIRKMAIENLSSTRDAYKKALQEPYFEDDGRTGFITLRGNALALMIENGAAAFDMKDGFARSEKRKRKKDGGWYLTVPFRWATPNALGENEAFSNKMTTEVYNQAKKLIASTNDSAGDGKRVKIWGGSLNKGQVTKALGGYSKGGRPAFSSKETGQTFGAYEHKNSIYEGIYRSKRTYEKSTQTTYVSFRRVSDKSDPMSWIHAGLTARRFFEKSLQQVDFDDIATEVLSNFIRNL